MVISDIKHAQRLRKRFYDKVQATPTVKGCLEWTASTYKFGYGCIMISFADGRRSSQLAHRIAYVLHYGGVEDGMEVRHTCDNPPCVNIDHLKQGTHLDNMRDMRDRNRMVMPSNPFGENHIRAKLSDAAVEEIRAMHQVSPLNTTPLRVEVAKRYGCSHETIRALVENRYRLGIPIKEIRAQRRR